MRREAVGVDIRAATHVVAALIKYLGLAPLLPAAFAVGYSQPVWPFVSTTAAWTGGAWLVERATSNSREIGAREGFLIVALTWLLAAGVAATPYLLSGESQLAHPVDAYFEAMSGFTTTGATIVTDIEALDRSLAMWRQFTQWLGGMGIIVLAIAVLPKLRVGGRQLLESELPGPEVEPLAARVRDTARRLWLLYIALTLVEFAVLTSLWLTGIDERMSPFDALAHAFTTMPTGGFSTHGRGIEDFAAATQWVIVTFMILAGANFALMYRTFKRRDLLALPRDDEFRLYLLVLTFASAMVAFELAADGLFEGESAVRHAVFNVVSIMTTTGYASTDFNEWPLLLTIILVGLMFIGGSAGSTSGSVKVVRHLLLGKILRREIDQTVHPELVAVVRLSGRSINERTLRAVATFILIYIGIFALGALLLFVDAARANLPLDAIDGIAIAATTIGNVGPAFGVAGPMGSFEPLSDASKSLLIVLMWVGRLEIVPVVVLLTRNYWRA